jgi:pimeloyl-ACP methyl ester carboxylesterase
MSRGNSGKEHSPEGFECAYSVQGAGPAIIMVHGIGAQMQVWSLIVRRLQSAFQCITFDLRGHGSSPVPTDRFGIGDLIADLEILRKRLALERFHLVGHSLGAMIAAGYTLQFPQHVLSLGLFSTAAFRTDEDRERIRSIVAAIREKGLEANFDTLLRRWYTDQFLACEQEFIARRRDQLLGMNEDVLLNVFEIYAEHEMGPALREIEVPTLVVTGENDPGCNPRLNHQIANALPNAKLALLPGLRHSILIEGAAPLAEAISQFLFAQSPQQRMRAPEGS